jgi:hypothetical protein
MLIALLKHKDNIIKKNKQAIKLDVHKNAATCLVVAAFYV